MNCRTASLYESGDRRWCLTHGRPVADEPSLDCVQCGARRKRGESGKWWPTGKWSCALCYSADFR